MIRRVGPASGRQAPALLISACLLGVPCNFRGEASSCWEDGFAELSGAAVDAGLVLLPVCPEQLGGLGTPRPRAELQGAAAGVIAGRGRVLTVDGDDVTREFLAGARKAASQAAAAGARWAVLKERSPSCGSQTVHAGFFSGALTAGPGLTAHLLQAQGVFVFSEREFLRLWRWSRGFGFLENPWPFVV